MEDFFVETNAVLESNIIPLLPSLTIPTLVLGTHNSALLPAAEEQWKLLAGLIPGARLFLFDDARMLGGLSTDENEPPAATRMIEFFDSLVLHMPGGAGHEGISFARLSPRELEVWRLMATGKSNQEIAGDLVISRNTVRRHVSSIFDKTGVTNRTQAVVLARDYGIV